MESTKHTTWHALVSVQSVYALGVVPGIYVFWPFALLKVLYILAFYSRLVGYVPVEVQNKGAS